MSSVPVTLRSKVEGAGASLRMKTHQGCVILDDGETYSTINPLATSLRGVAGARAVSARRLRTFFSSSMASEHCLENEASSGGGLGRLYTSWSAVTVDG